MDTGKDCTFTISQILSGKRSISSNTLYLLSIYNEYGRIHFGDHLGSASVTADRYGSSITRQLYKPFGETRSSGSVPTKYTFTGQYSYSTEIGLMYYVARFFDPQLGRFVSPDTIIPRIGGALAWDRYLFVLGNPLSYTDPSGHFPWLLVGVLVFIAVNLTGDSARPPNYPINASSSEPCNSSLSGCFGDVVKLDDFSGNGEDNPISIEEFNAFADEVAYDLDSHDLTWPGFSAGRHVYDTPFYNGGESSGRTGVEGSEQGLYPSNQQVCIETIGCSGRSEINYIAQGMWGAATNETKLVSHGIAYAWKLWEYGEPPSEYVLFWIDYGYDYYRQWKENQK